MRKKEENRSDHFEPKVLSEKELQEMWNDWHTRPLFQYIDAVNMTDTKGELVRLKKFREDSYLISKDVASWDKDYGIAIRPGIKYTEAKSFWKQFTWYEHKRMTAEKSQMNFSEFAKVDDRDLQAMQEGIGGGR